MKLFDYVKSIDDKKYSFNVRSSSGYSPYMITENYGMYTDTLFISDAANMLPKLSRYKKLHYDYYYYMVRKGRRFTKWPSKNKNKYFDAVSFFYPELNKSRIEECIDLLTTAQKEELLVKYEEHNAK